MPTDISPGTRLRAWERAAEWPPAGAAVVGVLAVLLGSVLPRRHHSPGSRRAVDLLEGLAIAAVVPLACAVADLFSVVRLL